MEIKGIEQLSEERINFELENGAKFVVFEYCISLIIVTFKRASDVHFVLRGQRGWSLSWPYSAVSLLLGWWGIPWGPVWTIATLITNMRGGRDVTEAVLAASPAETGGL